MALKGQQVPGHSHAMQSASGGSSRREWLMPGVWNGGVKGLGQWAAEWDHRHQPWEDRSRITVLFLKTLQTQVCVVLIPRGENFPAKCALAND